MSMSMSICMVVTIITVASICGLLMTLACIFIDVDLAVGDQWSGLVVALVQKLLVISNVGGLVRVSILSIYFSNSY